MKNRMLNEILYYTKPFKPGLIAFLLKSWIFQNDQNPPLTIDVSLGTDCNMKCIHCSAATLDNNNRKVLSLIDYQRLALEFDRLRVTRINLTGGEPLLRQDFQEILKALGVSRRHVKLQTNGLLLDEKKIQFIKKCGVNAVSISLDTLNAEEYAKFRGVSRDSHAKVIRNLKLAQASGLQTSTSCVLTHHNLRTNSILEIIEFAKINGFILLANIATASGRWQARPDYLFNAEDRAFLNDLLVKYPHVRTDHDAHGCPAAVRKIYITPYGDVLPCPFIHVSFGNIRDEALGTIRQRMLAGYPFSGSQICPAGEDKNYFNCWHQRIAQADSWPVQHTLISGGK